MDSDQYFYFKVKLSCTDTVFYVEIIFYTEIGNFLDQIFQIEI